MNNKGFVLMVTMWVMVMLTVMALSFSLQSRQGSASTSSFKEEIIARSLAVSAYEEALAYLLGDKDPEVDYLDSDGHFHTDAERPAITGKKTVGDAVVEINITDEESRLNLNFMSPGIFRDLLIYAGVPEDKTQAMLDSVSDWTDPDDLLHLSGAEDDYYEPLGYKPKNKPLDTPDELLLIKGFRPEYVYGGEDFTALYPLVTTLGRGININTVSSELLEVMGFSPPEVDSILASRGDGGLRSAPSRLGGFGITASQNFRIDVSASIRQSPRKVRITAILYRPPDGTGLRNIYWKEQVESIGRT